MSHTKGKLIVNYSDILDKNLHPVFRVSERENKEEKHANARRLVACWNACNGLPTEALEIMPATIRGALNVGILHQERDEALDVLRLVGSDISTTLYRLNAETEARVKAIIAPKPPE